MKTENEVLQIIANQLQETIAKFDDEKSDYRWIICTERIFLDDYKPKVDDYIARLNLVTQDGSYDLDSMPEGYENPSQMPYQHTIFAILDMGQGQVNFAVWNCPVSIRIISEENTFDMAREIMTEFMSKVNFEYKDGIIQSYFTPEVTDSMSEMYAGFRGLMSCSGFVRVPEPNILFATKVMVDLNGDGNWTDFPFISITLDHSGQPDAQAFSGYYGATMSLNRMTTQALSVSTYLWQGTGNETLDGFSKAVLNAMNDMNRKFHLAVLSNIESDDENAINGLMPIMEAHFVLIGAQSAQEWGDLSVWSLSFARAKDKEEGE